jgi:hypothetical protein
MLGAGVSTLRLPRDARNRTLEAALQLTRASVELRVLSPARAVGLLGSLDEADADHGVDADQLREAALVGRTVARVSRRLPWHPTCLRQALAARRMLRRRGVPSRLHLGVVDATLGEAHAWVTVGDRPVVGRPGVERFTPLAAFG